MSYSVDEIRKNYEGFSDDKLLRIATESASTLTPEALEILKAELQKRNLSSEKLLEAIQVQSKQLTDGEIEEHVLAIENLPCPICGSTAQKLNLSSVFTVKSFVFITMREGRNVIACPDCLRTTIGKANRTTWLLGWWGIPTGVIRSLGALRNNAVAKHRLADRHPLLKEFVKLNVEGLELAKGNPQRLSSLIKENNEFRS